MVIVRSQNNVPIRLTAERWAHITRQHPEMATQRERILETVNTPDMIQAGDFGELLAVRFYPQTPLTEKYLVVAYRETAVDDGYILTAYLARRPSVRREVIWRR
jgi:hypothetical protein